MNNAAFYKEIVKRGVYSVFNELRTGLFGRLATDSHIPIAYSKLDEVLSECCNMPPLIKEFVKINIPSGDRFRYHYCETEGLCLHYFVDVSGEALDVDRAAVHQQYYCEENKDCGMAVSAVVLYEKHPLIQPINYPKIIKHEITHAAIEYVIGRNKELFMHYFSNDDETRLFMEFICDLIPYVSTPSKKENGINKFISDSEECFGYDAEEGQPAEFIKTVIGAMAEGVEEDVTLEEPSYEEFKSLKDKYSFILRNMDGRSRCDILGITKLMYYKRELADRWYYMILDILGEDENPDTVAAKETLDRLYGNMIEDDTNDEEED